MERIELHEIPGFSFGQVQDVAAGTGCTVILCPQGAVTGVDIRGGSPGTRDTAALDPLCNRSVVHAVVLTGGSAFGLDAAGGVMKKLEEEKPVIFCGDLNVAHEEIDLKNPKSNRKNAGFTDEERGKIENVLASGFIDTFRYFYPDVEEVYSWWSYRFKARERNVGWRIDYFIASEKLKDKLLDARVHGTVMGSDHCPVELDIDI